MPKASKNRKYLKNGTISYAPIHEMLNRFINSSGYVYHKTYHAGLWSIDVIDEHHWFDIRYENTPVVSCYDGFVTAADNSHHKEIDTRRVITIICNFDSKFSCRETDFISNDTNVFH